MTTGLRRTLVAALIVALSLAGLGRALAADPRPTVASIGGVSVPICHSGASEAPADPAQPIGHDCCDGCALFAPAVLPSPPALTGPAPAAHYADHARAIPWWPAVARPRDPRLSRGPPAA